MVHIRHIETLVPEVSLHQDAVAQMMKKWIPAKKAQRYIDGIYQNSGIETRHSVIGACIESGGGSFVKPNGKGGFTTAGTRERNDLFASACSDMSVKVVERALQNCEEICTRDITHVVTVSCTGFYNPGPDYAVIQELGLAPTVERYNLGFMGCCAALPALRMARQFCQAQPEAVVLVVCIELCTLHLQTTDDLDSILAGSLFADGAAAVIVTAKPPPARSRVFELDSFSSTLIPESAGDMAWRIGDHGFDLVLSKYVPRIIEASIAGLVEGILNAESQSPEDIAVWAVHPGGKSIVDKIERSLGLKPAQIAASRNVLRRCGNMSSATILFVLKEILDRADAPARENIFAVAFGPGLTVESTRLCAERPCSQLDTERYTGRISRESSVQAASGASL